MRGIGAGRGGRCQFGGHMVICNVVVVVVVIRLSVEMLP